MAKRLLDYDAFSGVQTWHEYDKDTQQTRISYTFTRDESPTVDLCKAIANDGSLSQRGIKEDWWPYAHIPNSLMLKWYLEEGIPLFDAEEYNKKANTQDYKFLKLTTKTDGSGTNKIIKV